MLSFHVVFFDLDGTLTDSRSGIINSINYALQKLGIKEADPAVLTQFIGPPLADSFKFYYGLEGEELKRAVTYYREYFSSRGIFENRLYPGVRSLLQGLKQDKKTIALATSKPTVYAQRILTYFELDAFFSEVIGSNLDGSRTSKGEIIRHAIQKLGLRDTEGVVMVGDRRHDIIGARENGIASVGVLYGYGSVEELKEAGPDYLTHSVAELSEIL